MNEADRSACAELLTQTTGLVSVVMPCRNAAKTLAFAVNSVIKQKYRDWELFIIDDASTDGSPEIAASFEKSDSRIKTIRNSKQLGTALSRNRGIEQAAGKYVALLDADDCWLERKLAAQVCFMQEHDADISCTAYRYMSPESIPLGSAVSPPPTADFNALLRGNTLASLTVMVRAEIIKRHLFLPDAFHEDYIAWLEIVRETGGCAYGIPEVLSLYRVGHGSKSADKLRSARKTYEVYRKHFNLGLLKSCSCMFFYTVNGTVKYGKRVGK